MATPTRQEISKKYGDELVEMIDTLVAQQMEKITKIDFFDELSEKFENNITKKLPDMRELFHKLDQDVALLEEESRVLDEDIAKLKKTNTPVVNAESSFLSQSERLQAFSKKFERSNDSAESSTGQRLTRLEELRKHFHNGKISEIALYPGVSVLGLCKEEWKEGIIEDVQKHKDRVKYKVRFTKFKRKSLLQINHLACIESRLLFPSGQIPVGSRVAACYKDEGIYSGVIAESADRRANRGRYLIFYDDGYTMYCSPSSVYVVYGSVGNVWDDIPQKGTAAFVQDYLSTSERQLLSLKEGQTLKVEFEGVWHKARCSKVDCSLVEIHYLSDGSTEWIYRGSRRLEPLLLQQQMSIRSEKPSKIARAHTGMRRAHIEFVDLTEDAGTSSSKSSVSHPIERKDQWIPPWALSLTEQKANTLHSAPTRIPHSFTELQGGYDVASQIQNRFEQKQHGRSSSASDSKSLNVPKTKPRYRSVGDRLEATAEIDDGVCVDSSLEIYKRSVRYVAHTCSKQCVVAFSKWPATKLLGINPLTKPLLSGWTREICRIKPGMHRTTFHVFYRAPCGRACRSMADVDRYLRETGLSNLDYDHFSFDHTVRTIIGSSSNITTVKRPRDAKYFIFDYSDGKEDVPISCVNEINSEKPPEMPYTKTRVPGKGVQINTDANFMVCCDCTDNCRDRSKCPCQQLTVQATSCSHGRKIKKEAGYQYKRLFSFLPTGIYECNSRCKCNTQCLNRVVQKGLQCRLQMFKTQKKGWGIRCLDDIPRGSFVCIYTGRIETEIQANFEGLLHGDEYLAELDHIEVAENQKEDYNSDHSSGFESNTDESGDDDDTSLDTKRRSSTFSDADEDVTDDSFERKLGPVTFIGGQKRKLGYSIETRSSPSPLPETFQQRRGKTMLTKKPPRSIDRSDSSSSNHSRSMVASRDEDTTDTDSDTDLSCMSRIPMARKSTTSRSSNKKVEIESDDEDETIGTRKFFGNEEPFIIDAKQTGNLGRYLNHSCTPNLMVQNVFLDTHDLRFPWVAFFASSTIRAGTELTWDYNYEIGSVPDRIIHCYCGSTKCRKRLL